MYIGEWERIIILKIFIKRTFENITDCAISAVNFKNIEVKGNKFLNCKYSAFYRDNGK